MGMITRVRGRLQSFSLPPKLQVKAHDEKQTKTVCLISAALLLPYFTKYYSPVLVTALTLFNSCFLVPLLLSSWPVNKIQQWLNGLELLISEYAAVVGNVIKTVGAKALNYIDRAEKCFLDMKNLYAIFSQIMFFALADNLLRSDQKLSCLYSLMFFNVFAYCISYVKHLLTKEDWSPYVRISESTNVKHLAMTTVKLTLEFTKAVTFIITVVFMLLVFGLEQGLEHYKPTWPYLLVTAIFYIVTEKTFVEIFPSLLEKFQFEILENLETLWAPVILRTTTVALSTLFVLPAILFCKFRLLCISSYINIYLGYKDLATHSWACLQKERALLMKYRFATARELREKDDVCAVCLQSMRFARITPCQHMFHGDCLRRCLKERFSCPMCKQDL